MVKTTLGLLAWMILSTLSAFAGGNYTIWHNRIYDDVTGPNGYNATQWHNRLFDTYDDNRGHHATIWHNRLYDDVDIDN